MHGVGWLVPLLAWASGKYGSLLTERGFAHRASQHLLPCVLLEIRHPYTQHLTENWVTFTV